MTARVLVLGGGKAGGEVAAALLKALPAADLTLVDARDKAYHMIAAPRAMVDPARVKPENLHIPVAPLFSRAGRGKFVKGLVKEVGKNQAVLNDGTVLPFDYLVVALVCS